MEKDGSLEGTVNESGGDGWLPKDFFEVDPWPFHNFYSEGRKFLRDIWGLLKNPSDARSLVKAEVATIKIGAVACYNLGALLIASDVYNLITNS